MHDPSTVAFDIKYPWYRTTPFGDYHDPFITIWHRDPETDGSDDSCGWFPRARHGDKAVLEKVVKRFESDWDRTWISDSRETYLCGFFSPTGQPVLSPIGITINLFFLAALEFFGNRDAAASFMNRHLFEIAFFAENRMDSLHESITLKFGNEDRRDERIRSMAGIIYGWILRESRPWYRHPKWHLWHWRIQVHPWQQFRRFLLTRCCKCGKGFRYGESPTTSHWDRPKVRFLRGEVGLYHSDCNNRERSGLAQAAK